MPAKPDVVDEELEPWSGSLEARFEIEDALVEGDFAEVRAAGGRIVRSRLDRVVLTGSFHSARIRNAAFERCVLGPAKQLLRRLGAVSRRQAPPAMLDGLAPACARVRPLASTIRTPNPPPIFFPNP